MATLVVVDQDTGELATATPEAFAVNRDRYRLATPDEVRQGRERARMSVDPAVAGRLQTEQALRRGLNLKDWATNLRAGLRDVVTTQALPMPADVREQSQANLRNVLAASPSAENLPGGTPPEREIPFIGSTGAWRATSNLLGTAEAPLTAAVQTAREADQGKIPAWLPKEGRFLYNLGRHVVWPSERKSTGQQLAQTVREEGKIGYSTGPSFLDRAKAEALTALSDLGSLPSETAPLRTPSMRSPGERRAATDAALKSIAPEAGTPEFQLGGLSERTAETAGDIAFLAAPPALLAGPPMALAEGLKGAGKLVGKGAGLAISKSPQLEERLTRFGDWFRKGGSMARMEPAAARSAVRTLIKGEVEADLAAGRVADELDQGLTLLERQLGRKPTQDDMREALRIWEESPNITAALNSTNPLVRSYAKWEAEIGQPFGATTHNRLWGREGGQYARHEFTGERQAEEAMKALGIDPAVFKARGATAGAAENPLAVESTKRRYLNEALNAARAKAGLPPIPDTVSAMNDAFRRMGFTYDVFTSDPRVQATYRIRQARQAAGAKVLQRYAEEFGRPLSLDPTLTAGDRASMFTGVPGPKPAGWSPPLTYGPGSRVPDVPAWSQAVPGGERIALPKEIADYLERTARSRWVDKLTGSSGIADAVMREATGSSKGGLLHEWTGLATVARPGYHFRNFLNNQTARFEELGGQDNVFMSPGWFANRELARQVVEGTEPAWLKAAADEARALGHVSPPGGVLPTEMSWSGIVPSQRIRKMGPWAGQPVVLGQKAEAVPLMSRIGPSSWSIGGVNYLDKMGEAARTAEELDRAQTLVAAVKRGMSPTEATDAVTKIMYNRYSYPEGVRGIRHLFPFGGWQFSNLKGKLERTSTPGVARMAKAGTGLERVSEDVTLSDENRQKVRTRAQGQYAAQVPKVYLGATEATGNPVYVNNPGTAYGELSDLVGMLTPFARYLASKGGIGEPSKPSEPVVESGLSGAMSALSRMNPAVTQGLALLNLDPKRQRTLYNRQVGPEGEPLGLLPQHEKAGRGSAALHQLVERLGGAKPGPEGEPTELPFLGTVRPAHGGPVQQSLISKRLFDIWPSPFGSATEIVNPESEIDAYRAALAFLMGGTAGSIDFDLIQQAQNAADREARQKLRTEEGKLGPVPSLMRRLQKPGR